MTKILEKENENNSLDLHFREEKLENDLKKNLIKEMWKQKWKFTEEVKLHKSPITLIEIEIGGGEQ